jgi:hypothetical protein
VTREKYSGEYTLESNLMPLQWSFTILSLSCLVYCFFSLDVQMGTWRRFTECFCAIGYDCFAVGWILEYLFAKSFLEGSIAIAFIRTL